MSSSRVLVFLIIFGLAYYGLTSMYISAYGGVLPTEAQKTLEAADVIPGVSISEAPALKESYEIAKTPMDIISMTRNGEIAVPTDYSILGKTALIIYRGMDTGIPIRELKGTLVTSGIDGKDYFIFDPRENLDKFERPEEVVSGISLERRLEIQEEVLPTGIKRLVSGDIDISGAVAKSIMKDPYLSGIMEAITKIKSVMSHDWHILSSIFKGGFFSNVTDGAIISMLWCLFLGIEIWDRLPSGGTVGTLLKYGVGLGIFAFILLPLPAF